MFSGMHKEGAWSTGNNYQRIILYALRINRYFHVTVSKAMLQLVTLALALQLVSCIGGPPWPPGVVDTNTGKIQGKITGKAQVISVYVLCCCSTSPSHLCAGVHVCALWPAA